MDYIDFDHLRIVSAFKKSAIMTDVVSSYDFDNHEGERLAYECYNNILEEIEKSCPETDLDTYQYFGCIYYPKSYDEDSVKIYVGRHWNLYMISLGIECEDSEIKEINL